MIFAAGAIDAEEAFSFVNGRLLALIFSCLAIGAAITTSMVLKLIVNLFIPLVSYITPFVAIWSVYLMTSV